jgi:glutaredoxin 2
MNNFKYVYRQLLSIQKRRARYIFLASKTGDSGEFILCRKKKKVYLNEVGTLFVRLYAEPINNRRDTIGGNINITSNDIQVMIVHRNMCLIDGIRYQNVSLYLTRYLTELGKFDAVVMVKFHNAGSFCCCLHCVIIKSSDGVAK